MLRYALRKLVGAVAVVVAVTAITFVMVRLLRPEAFAGDPRPLPQALVEYLRDAFLYLDLGRSWEGSRPEVSGVLLRGFAGDLWLLLGGLAFGVAAGVAGGAYVAARPRSLSARAVEAAGAFFLCAPVYWVGLMLTLLFARGVGAWLEVPLFETNVYAGLTENPARWLQSLVVPWIVLGLPLAAVCLRMMASSMREILDEDYIRTATAKGLARRAVMGRHAVRAASSPVMSLTGVTVPIVVTNMVLVEQVFSIPGVYQDLTGAMSDADFPMLQGLVLVTAVFVVLAGLLADLALAWLDPRVRA